MGYPVGALQGNLSQKARELVMQGFPFRRRADSGSNQRGRQRIGLRRISQVINYDLPDSELLFTHRVGRTGRMGRSGEAVTFITADEERKWREIERGPRPPVCPQALAAVPQGHAASITAPVASCFAWDVTNPPGTSSDKSPGRKRRTGHGQSHLHCSTLDVVP